MSDSGLKVPKPDKFDGSDLSLATVTNWAYSIEEYMALSGVPEDAQTRWAGIFLDKEAKVWFRNTYGSGPFPALDDFLKTFKAQFLASHSDDDIIIRLSKIEQGSRSTMQYSTEFQMLVLQLGKPDNRYAKHDYMRGLHWRVRNALLSGMTGEETLEQLVNKACLIARNLDFGKSLESKTRASLSAVSSTAPSSSAGPRSSRTSINRDVDSTGKFVKRLTDAEKEYLRTRHGCFNCRKTNAGHIAPDCPEDYSGKGKFMGERSTKVKKEPIVSAIAVVESDSDSEYSSAIPKSVPTIKITTNIGGVELPSSLADCGAMINIISQDKVDKHSMETVPIPPMHICEPINARRTLINRKVVSKVQLPDLGWESQKPAEFAVAPLQEHDAVLGMPFLAKENILVDPGQHKIIVPDQLLRGTEEKKSDYMAPVFPSICPKIGSAQRNKYFTELNNYFLMRFSDVFTATLPDKLPHSDSPRHRIVLRNEDISLNGRNYRIPTRYWLKLKEFIDMHLKAGRIRPSSSHIASGTLLVDKPTDPKMPRVVHDYRALNAETIKDHTPLPRQDDIMECMARAKVRGKIDLVCAYYQILMEIADIHKTAFKTPFGMYEWLVMPQGLCNAVATFQRYMNWVLRDYVGKFCAVYIDDIGIWSNSVEEHSEHVRLILEKLREAGISASVKKSVLFADEIYFLGHTISSRGIQPAQTKIDGILAARVPCSPADIKEFLGLVNYIAQFLPGLSEWSTVLSGLTRKGVKFDWLPEHEEAFCNIKRLAKNYPVCKPLDYDSTDPIMLIADASNRGLGGYFGQGTDYKTLTPAGFHSRAFNEAERNYPTHDKEMLAIIDCLKKFEPHLTGVKFEILTDHAPLTHWQTQKELSPRQIRWNDTLSRFDARIRHIPGISNCAADALSRYPYVQKKESPRASDASSISAISLVEFDPDILHAVRMAYPNDSLFAAVIDNPERYPFYHLDDGLLFFEGRLCIPGNDRKSREKLLKLHHDEMGNHFGPDKTRRSLMRDYYWPGIQRDVDLYVKSCNSCGRNKSSTQAPAGFLHPMPIPKQRFDELALDFVGPVPMSKGYDTILVMTDRLTNYVKLEPTVSTASAQDIARLVYASWYRQFGLPKAITSDRDKLFTSKFWKELHKRMKISLRMSTAYHPETDGSSERSNKTMIEALRHYVNFRHSDWAEYLIHVEAAMNNSVNATTGMSPTELVYGSTLRLFPSPRDLVTSTQEMPAVSDYIQRIQGNIAMARDCHAEAKTRQATYANRKRRPEPEYKVGEKVYLETKDLRLRVKQKGRSAKFYSRYVGPFEITESRPETSNYTLKLPKEYQIHPTVHARRLKRALDNDPVLFPNRVPSEPPPIDAEDNQYTVEAILDHRTIRRKREFLVHWEGYSDLEDSWIKEEDINPELIRAYFEQIATEKTGI